MNYEKQLSRADDDKHTHTFISKCQRFEFSQLALGGLPKDLFLEKVREVLPEQARALGTEVPQEDLFLELRLEQRLRKKRS